jgi:hypothetical protein
MFADLRGWMRGRDSPACAMTDGVLVDDDGTPAPPR